MNEPTLFEVDDGFKDWQRPIPPPPAEALARGDDPETSKIAARALGGKAGTMRRGLLDAFALGGAGLTAERASYVAGYGAADGAWKRVSDLLNAGLIEPTGETEIASTGRPQRVLRITALGIAALPDKRGMQ